MLVRNLIVVLDMENLKKAIHKGRLMPKVVSCVVSKCAMTIYILKVEVPSETTNIKASPLTFCLF